MTLFNVKHGLASCSSCSHDLVSRLEHEGRVYCSNSKCEHSAKKAKKPHPTGSDPNKGADK